MVGHAYQIEKAYAIAFLVTLYVKGLHVSIMDL